MKPTKISMNATIAEVETLLEKEKNISPTLKTAIKILIVMITMFDKRLGLNSQNSSKPPADDKNRNRGNNRKKSDKKPGGQNGHVGTKLTKIADPDRIEEIKVDRRYLPKSQYHDVGYESRQVFDIEFSRVVTEYRAQILENQEGVRFVADFPQAVKSSVQYGSEVKVNSVYMSQFQLLPYNRIQDQFADQMNLPLSTGTIFNFNQEAYELLEQFDAIVKIQLTESQLVHADETGINVNKKRIWLHSASNEKWTHFYPHQKRGSDAMDEIGIIPRFKGVLCHDHWKPYYKYSCLHALCNAHHIRELTSAEEDHQQWATLMKSLLLEINKAIDEAGGELSSDVAIIYRNKYREILKRASETECPPPANKENGKRGRTKKTTSRNLLERLRDFENDTLRFLDVSYVPFTNNQGENDIRMTKVQQKISGCFRSMEGAYIFCRIRGYLSTCRKNNISATEALRILFGGKLPGFAYNAINSS